MDPISGFYIRLVFTLPPRESKLQYKICVHFRNNFPALHPCYPLILKSVKKIANLQQKQLKFSCLGRSSLIEIESSTSKLAAAVLSGLEFHNN